MTGTIPPGAISNTPGPVQIPASDPAASGAALVTYGARSGGLLPTEWKSPGDFEIEQDVLIPLTAAGTDASAALDVFEFVVVKPFSLRAVSFQCDSDNPPTGSAAQIDVSKNGTSIFNANPTIDSGEYSSATAATPPALITTPTTFAAGDVVTFDLDQVGAINAGRDYKAVLHVTETLKE